MDFNGNGRLDIISGSYHPGDLYLFARQEDGSFAKGQIINGADGKPVNVGQASHVFAVDWNGDDSLDLIVGNIRGQVLFIPNEGTDAEPKFGAPQRLQANGRDINMPGGDAGPTVADWDGDGHPDLIVGADDGSVHLFRSTAQQRDGLPVLAAGEVLVPAADRAASSADRPGSRAKPHVTDFNGDGRPDLLVGDFTYVQVQRGPLSADERARLQELQKEQQDLQRQWQQTLNEAMRQLPPGEDPQQRMQQAQEDPEVAKVLERLRTVMAEVSELQPSSGRAEGYVWFYARKPAGEQARHSP